MCSAGIVRRKCQRLNLAGHAHELTFSCNKRRQLLLDERVKAFLGQAIKEAKEKHSFELWAYVFMPEHVHLLVFPKSEDCSISAILQSIKQPVSRRAINYFRRTTPERMDLLATGQKGRPYRFWLPGGGYDRNIVSESVLRRAVDYMHNNPVRRGLVVEPSDWFWSSAGDWAGLGEGPIRIDRESLSEAFR